MFKCPSCDVNRSVNHLFDINEYPIYECGQCTHQFTDLDTSNNHVEKVYSDDYFESGEAGYPNYVGDAQMLIKRGKYYSKKISNFMAQGKILDIGAAAGFILKGFIDSGWEGEGIEPNQKMANFGQKEFGLTIHSTSVENFKTTRSYDLVTMIQVLPHFYDLNQGLSKIAEMTKTGGYWLIETWNKDSWTARKLGKNWHEYSPPSVLHWFSPETVTQFAADYGMEFVAKGRPTKKISSSHAKSLVRYKIQNKPIEKVGNIALKLIPDNIILPYYAEDLFWILLKKTA